MTGTITPIGVNTAQRYTRLATAGSGPDMLAAPGNTNAPIIFEPSAALSGGDLEVWMIASGGAGWGGCQVWVSSDGSTYALAGTVYKGARQGTLTAILPSSGDPDTTDTLAVDLSESQGQLLSGTLADANNFVTLCYCDGELVSYETATLTAAYKYNLTYLRRGVYGTPIGSHAAGAAFARFGPNDPSLFKYDYPASFVGQTIYVKLPAFNLYGQALQSLADVSAATYTLSGAGGGAIVVSGSYTGPTTPSLVVERYVFPQPASFPAGLVGSQGRAGTAATAASTYTIQKNASNVGTMAFAASATSASFTMASATAFAVGDVLTIVAPGSPDATLSAVFWSLLGTVLSP